MENQTEIADVGMGYAMAWDGMTEAPVKELQGEEGAAHKLKRMRKGATSRGTHTHTEGEREREREKERERQTHCGSLLLKKLTPERDRSDNNMRPSVYVCLCLPVCVCRRWAWPV